MVGIRHSQSHVCFLFDNINAQALKLQKMHDRFAKFEMRKKNYQATARCQQYFPFCVKRYHCNISSRTIGSSRTLTNKTDRSIYMTTLTRMCIRWCFVSVSTHSTQCRTRLLHVPKWFRMTWPIWARTFCPTDMHHWTTSLITSTTSKSEKCEPFVETEKTFDPTLDTGQYCETCPINCCKQKVGIKTLLVHGPKTKLIRQSQNTTISSFPFSLCTRDSEHTTDRLGRWR